MPPSSILRETRAQKRRSCAGSGGFESVQAPSSTRTTTPRRKPNVRPKPNSNYGAVDSQAPAQKQAAKLATREATDRIEAVVSAAIERSATRTTNTKGLTSVAEEDEREAVEDGVSPREEYRMVFNNRVGESEWTDHHHSACDQTGSKSSGREAQDLSGLLQRQTSCVIRQQPAASSRDAISAQPVSPNQHDMPPPLQAPIHPPPGTNSPVTAPFSPGEIPIPWTRKRIWLTLIICVILSLSSAALSTLRYRQMTTSFSKFQNYDKKVSSVIPAMLSQRLYKLEGQVLRLTESAINNRYARSRQINWFSFDLGARADPYLSSPCARRPKLKIKSKWSLRWKDIKSSWKSSPDDLPLQQQSPSSGGSSSNAISPNTALTPWIEFEPRYCAPSGRGKLQLAVITPRPITPTELVVEHFRRDQVPLIGSAPKEVELWIEIRDDDNDDDAKLREEVTQRIMKIYPDILSRTYTQKDRLLDPKLALGPEWVPVGRWTYQISAHDNVQYFRIPLDLASLGVVAKQQVVRVNSNWGNVDRTCLVRVGLHGEDPSAPAEYLEDDIGPDEDY